MVQIKKHRSFTELQFGIVALVLGNKAIIFLSVFMMVNLFSMFERANEELVLWNMRIVKMHLEYFAMKRIEGTYPTSMHDKTISGGMFSELIYNFSKKRHFENPYTNRIPNVIFIYTSKILPKRSDTISIPPGDIYIFCDGTEYIILGGGKNGTSLSFCLTSEH